MLRKFMIMLALAWLSTSSTYAEPSTQPMAEKWLQLMQTGSAERQSGNLAMAEKHWRQALDLSERFAIQEDWQDQNLKCLMTIFDEQGKCSDLENFLRIVIAKRKGDMDTKNPSLICPLDCLGTTLACNGKLPETEATYKQALDIAFTDKDNKADYAAMRIEIHLAELHLKMGKPEDATGELALALTTETAIMPRDKAIAMRELARTMLKLDRPLEAVALAEYAKKLSSTWYQSPFQQLGYEQVLAKSLLKAGLNKQAIVPLTVAIAKAKQLDRKADLDELNKDLEQARRLAKLNPTITGHIKSGNVEWQIPQDLMF